MPPDPRLADLIARLDETRTGRPLSVEEVCADAPELAPLLREELARRREPDTAPHPADLDTATKSLPPPNPDDPPESVGGMKVIRLLGKGGMGWVLEVEDPKLMRRVAVKLMLPALAADPDARRRFLREARAQAAIDHENVAVIHAIHDEADPPYLVMPLLKGQTLAARIAAANGPLPVAEVIRIGAEMAAGLAAAHAGGLIHRDIKPSNVWLDGEKGRVKLLDFGLARALHPSDTRITHSGLILGTPAYMAPEQAAGGPVNHMADLFSVGVVLYEMATGVRPFRGDSIMSVLIALATVRPPAVNEINGLFTPKFATMINYMLAKTQFDRYPKSAKALLNRINNINMSDFSDDDNRSAAQGTSDSALTQPAQERRKQNIDESSSAPKRDTQLDDNYSPRKSRRRKRLNSERRSADRHEEFEEAWNDKVGGIIKVSLGCLFVVMIIAGFGLWLWFVIRGRI